MRALDPKVEAAFVTKVRELGLAHVAEKIRAGCRPALAVKLEPAGAVRVGASRVGGDPDLPRGAKWPTAEASGSTPPGLVGRKMTFIAQIDLQDLAGVPGCPLPKVGLLSFFLGADESAIRTDHRVVLHDARDLVRARTPSENEVVNDHYHPPFPELAMRFAPIATLPSFARDRDMDGHAGTLRALKAALTGGLETRVLGHPEDFSHDVLGPAYMHANGKAPCYPYLSLDVGTNPFTGEAMPGPFASPAEREAIAWFKADLDTNERCMADCQLLLQLESRVDTTMSFWDAGLLQFAGDDHAFARGDFSRTYACIQTG